MATISTQNLLAQSRYLYLQSAGSDGTDGTAPGIHLRWDLAGPLRDIHFPKGNLAATGSPFHTTAGYNKDNDFVKIYRTVYNQEFPVTIDLSTAPSQVTESAYSKVWKYNNIVPIAGIPSNTCNVILRFPEIYKYNQARASLNPATQPLSFIQAYDDIIEAEVEGRYMFSAEVFMTTSNGSLPTMARVESISEPGGDEEGGLYISCRKKYQAEKGYLLQEATPYIQQEDLGKLVLEQSGTGPKKVMAENIRYIRFKGSNCYPSLLKLETYQDFILGKNQSNGWDYAGQFALSIDDNEVFSRLEKPGSYLIDNRWPRYNDGDNVKVANYKSKWNDLGGLKSGVAGYLALSVNPANLAGTNTPSVKEIPNLEISEWEIGPSQDFEFNYLDMLRVACTDYHIARMLGLGHIDSDISPVSSQQYIHVAVYETTAALGSLPEGLHTHAYMTLPTSKMDYRLPPAPELLPVRYGMFLDNGTDTQDNLTDANGYSPYDDSRAINLDVAPFDTLRSFGPFFVPDEEFCYVGSTMPVTFGIEYRQSGEASWRKPEVSFDEDYKGYNDVYETVPVFYAEQNPIFIHIEKENGVHEYALYSINWFSRVSGLSNIQQTNETIFKRRNTLIPPLNLGVQLVQKEKTLMLTTEAEQDRLAQLTGDKTLLRVTFDWNDIHTNNYWYGKEAEFFFRTEPLKLVRGRVKSVTRTGDRMYEVRTMAYTMYSQSPALVVTPKITTGQEPNYLDSLMVVGEQQYIVRAVVQSGVQGEGPVFTIEAPKQTTLFDADLNNTNMLTVQDHPDPETGAVFAVSENSSLASAWPVKLNAKVLLKKLSDYKETRVDDVGNEKDVYFGGIFEKATITEIEDKDDQGGVIQGSRTGLYSVVFNSYVLAPHGASNVEWYKGKILLAVAGEQQKRALDVWHIDTSGSTLKLLVYDGTFDVSDSYRPQGSYVPIRTGSGIDVNFHPGYRVYLTAEANFNESVLLPAAEEEIKETYFACRSVDTDASLYSYIGVPGVILAREIVEPLPPNPPQGPLYATRPDFYGKATYTFNTVMNMSNPNRNPYALVFYRANERAVLDVLYKQETVIQILQDLAQIENDDAFTSRWNELVNVVTEAGGTDIYKFKQWNGYRFPNPDNHLYRIPDPDPGKPAIYPFNGTKPPGSMDEVANTARIFGESQNKKFYEIVQHAINSVFLSLTEFPVMYAYVKDGVYQTSNRKPVIRNEYGELLFAGAQGYDPAPMAVRFRDQDNNKVVRFTDYTLDGASRSFFFYYVTEMGNSLDFGPRSGILGPIKLVNSAPPRAPELKKFYTRPANALTGDTTAVIFEINPYLPEDGITKILIYRATNAADARGLPTMKLAATVSVGDPVIDDFTDTGLEAIPFGETLFYRLVAVRTITNEFDQPEDIPSFPSSLVLSNIIDVTNPAAPEITYETGPDSTAELLKDVTLEWERTVYGGTYYLYKMTPTGNWTKIYQVKSNEEVMQYYLGENLVKKDEDDQPLYHRFRVSVENSSGLLNIEENELTI